MRISAEVGYHTYQFVMMPDGTYHDVGPWVWWRTDDPIYEP